MSENGNGTIAFNTLDGLGQVTGTWVGTNATGATNSNPTNSGSGGNNLIQTEADVYDTDPATGTQTPCLPDFTMAEPALPACTGNRMAGGLYRVEQPQDTTCIRICRADGCADGNPLRPMSLASLCWSSRTRAA
jgi:hypothetical protein